ncbi:MAG: aminopeptidase P family protein [Candidatus Omnitrophica bacterium]|nr:aminopeptidase P family protein [Candidatus Omnitrophota bacterium]
MPLPPRIQELVAGFSKHGVDAVLVNHETDIRYLTQYPAKDAWLLVTPRQAFYITDARYIEEVRKEIAGVVPVKFEKSIFVETVALAYKAGVKCLGVDERHLTVYQYNRLKSFYNDAISMAPVDGLVSSVRMVKDKGELALMREAIALNLKAYSAIKTWVRPGVKEQDILLKLEAFIARNGVKFSFDPIIASGPNSAYPHAKVTERKLRANEPVLIDLGIDVKGYKSDLTRMFFLGRMPTSFGDVLSIVRDAQHEAFKVIRPGILAKDVDELVRNYLRKYGLAERFTHSLGHGVGLDIHEAPKISVNSEVVLAENMVFTVEPGVYFPGKYGIRLEEMVLVTKKGCEVLSDYDK